MSLPSENKMDPINSFLGRELLEEITPVVMVLSTSLAEDACQKNGLNFVEMLLPSSIFNKRDAPVRTASDQPYRLQMFNLRLVYDSDIHEQNYEGSRSTVNFILISKMQGNDSNLELVAPSKLLSNHVCHCSISSKSPIWWLMDGPRTINYDFSSSFFEAALHVTIRNCSKAVVSVTITTFAGLPDTNHLSDTVQVSDSSGNQGGWHDVPLEK